MNRICVRRRMFNLGAIVQASQLAERAGRTGVRCCGGCCAALQ
jgi:hypothetical protein